MPILHVHGALLEPPNEALVPDPWHAYSLGWRQWVPQAAAQIRVVHDQIEDDIVDAARTAIRNAAVICFLGFGYARENLARLGMPGVFEQHQPDLFGSAYGLRDGERFRVQRAIGKEIALGTVKSNGLDVLRDCNVFRE